jgi:hypothetical protein
LININFSKSDTILMRLEKKKEKVESSLATIFVEINKQKEE